MVRDHCVRHRGPAGLCGRLVGITVSRRANETPSSLASGSAIKVSFGHWFAQRTLASYNTGSWDAAEIKETGNMVYDPVTGLWILPYSGEDVSGIDTIGAILSGDGNTWYAHSQNPITGATAAEDPYICKTMNGEVYRDSDSKALMFCEEKTSATAHRGINLFKSAAGTLSGWTFFGRVLDRGTAGAWDDQDVTSPVVIYDGTQLVMLFEGRDGSLSGEAASIGVATSADEGETWSKSGSNPIIDRANVAWANDAIVCDDLINVNGTWVLTGHGSDLLPNFFNIGRWSTTVAPGAWNGSSFAEMTGNPFCTSTNTLMCWKNDPRWAVYIDRPQQNLLACVIVAA